MVSVAVLIAVGCGDPPPSTAPADVQGTVNAAVQATTRAIPAPTATLAPAPTPPPLDSAAIQQALTAAGIAVADVRAFTAENDPNQLLGRPGQYVAKVSWKDTRAQDVDATIEVFADDAALQASSPLVPTADPSLLSPRCRRHRHAAGAIPRPRG